jgi:DHA3 family macrolide efflux protein-like MFS transporter
VTRRDSGAPGIRLVTRTFSLFLAGQTLSQLGDRLNHMALIALVGVGQGVASGSMALAQLAVAAALPVLLVGPVAGVLVDRWDRRRTLISCDVIRTGLVASIPAVYRWVGAAWIVYVIVGAVFLTTLLYNCAKTAALPDIVSPGRLLSANAALTSVGRVATISGIVFGGLIVEWSGWRRLHVEGYTAGFLLDGATYALSALALCAIALPRVVRTPVISGGVARARFRRAWSEIRQAMELIRADARLRFLMGSFVVLACVAGAAYPVAIAFIQVGMGLGVSGVGAAGGMLAAGLIAGSALTGVIGRRWHRPSAVAAGIGGVGLAVLGLSVSHSFVAMAASAVAGGIALAPVMVVQDTELQEATPPQIRGRVSSAREIVVNAAFAGSAVLVGLIGLALRESGVGEAPRALLALVGCGALLASGRLAVAAARRPSRAVSPRISPSGLE